MAPRKGAKKGKRIAVVEEPAQTVPTDEEWGKMKSWASFTISDSDNNVHKFMRGQTATVLPHHVPPDTEIPDHEYWVVKIREIRGVIHEDGETNDVWAKVQWYYSREDVAGVVKSFDTEACSPYERVIADHFDIVSSEAFNEIITVQELKDDNIDQAYIDHETFYSRYTLERLTRRLKPKPGVDSCTCHKPYCYNDETTVMHFCPRPSCRKWYHESCLVRAKSRAPTNKNRGYELLATSPSSDERHSLSEFCVRSPPKRRKSSRGKVSVKEQEDEAEDTHLAEALEALPQDLLRIAEQPIVRGSLYKAGGVSGNVRPVVQARQIVHEVLGGDDLPEDWEDRVLGQVTAITLDDAIVRVKGKRAIPLLLCPACQSTI